MSQSNDLSVTPKLSVDGYAALAALEIAIPPALKWGIGGLDLQMIYFDNLADAYSRMENTAEMHFDLFTQFREYTKNRPDALLIKNALDGLQHANHVHLNQGKPEEKQFAHQSCEGSALQFMEDPWSYVTNPETRKAEIVVRYSDNSGNSASLTTAHNALREAVDGGPDVPKPAAESVHAGVPFH